MNAEHITFAALVLSAYLLGSVPTGLLLGKMRGIDVRKEGSGNIGATNLYRAGGRSAGILTLMGDCLKGLVPVLLAKHYFPFAEYAAWVGLAAFLGHVFSIFLLFKGGKGVATALGVFLVLSPAAVAISLAVFLGLLIGWRYVSLGSIAAAATTPLAIIWLKGCGAVFYVALIISAIIILKHHGNIKRLLSGAELRFKV